MIVVNDYKLFKKIGEGSFGEVYLTQKGDNPEIYATKRLNLQQTSIQTLQKYLKNEIEIMKELNHPNVIHLYDLLKTNTHYYIIMEYCNGGPLSKLLSDYKLKFGRPFSQEIIQHFMRQIVEGLKYIHSFKIIHRDIKLDNILVNYENIEDKNNFYLLKSQVKIIDFGLATKLTVNKLAETAAGSPIYMEPKILAKYNRAGGYDKLKGYNEKADIWSLGIICYEMLTGDTVYNNVVSIDQLMQKVEEGNYSIPLNCVLSNEIISFLNSMLQYDGDLRSSAEQLSQHKFLKKNVKDFTKADLEQIKNKINSGAIIINTKNNETICRVFNRKTVVNETNEPVKENDNLKSKVVNNPYNSFNNFQYTLNRANQNEKITNINKIKRISFSQKFNSIKNRLYEGLSSPNKNRIRKNFIEKNNENEIKELESMESSIQNLEDLKSHKKESKINNIENAENLQKGKENDEWKRYINALLEEYKSAKDYFGQNNLKIQEQDAYNKCLQIQNIKKQYGLGYSMYLKNLPESITPEYIYGYSTFERNHKFKEVLSKYKNNRNNLKTQIESSQKYAITDNLKQEYDNKKDKLTKLNYIIKELENGIKNEWMPAPEYTREIQKTQIERISYEHCEFKLKITIKNNDLNKKNTNFIISLKINESKNLKKDIQLNAQNNYYEECIWSMNVNEWKNIDNNVDFFIFEIKCNNNNGGTPFSFIVNIAQVKNGKEISFNVKLPVANNEKSVVNMIITPIIPEGKTYWKVEERLFLNIKTLYPAFEGKSLLTYNKPEINTSNGL